MTAPARRDGERFQPRWRPELEQEYAGLCATLERLLPCMEVPLHLPWIDAIRQLKRERGAVVMAHSYQSPEIFHGVADITGDSLALAQAAAECDAEVVVLAGVHFMAESAKLLAPQVKVLIPDPEAGCSLADSITGADVRALRQRLPGRPVVSYVNTSAEVKAESDICCTSANAVRVVESLGADEVIFLPDRHLGAHVASRTGVRLHLWDGRCEVHETFTAAEALHARERFDAQVVVHPECPQEVLQVADFVGSTSAMGEWIARERPARVALVTECSLADNLRLRFPDTEFIKPCNLCPYMKRITLPRIHACLRELSPEVQVPADIAARARRALERMLEVGRAEKV